MKGSRFMANVILKTSYLGPMIVSEDYAQTLRVCAAMAQEPEDQGFEIMLAIQDRTLSLLRAERIPDEAPEILADLRKKFPQDKF